LITFAPAFKAKFIASLRDVFIGVGCIRSEKMRALGQWEKTGQKLQKNFGGTKKVFTFAAPLVKESGRERFDGGIGRGNKSNMMVSIWIKRGC
jgi:hypothetical protein